jgi:hypothetical protein
MMRTSSISQLLETLRTYWRSILTDCPLDVLSAVNDIAREDAAAVYTRAMMHATDILRAEAVQEMWFEREQKAEANSLSVPVLSEVCQ